MKSAQDHVNEVMDSSNPKDLLEITFIPSTDYWKRIVRTSKHISKKGVEFQNSVLKSLNKENKNPNNANNQPYLSLFQDDSVQKETTTLLKRYLDQSEFMLKKEEANEEQTKITFHKNLKIETQKYLQMTRIYISLMILLLSKSKKDQLSALKSMILDLNCDNVKISEFLKIFFI